MRYQQTIATCISVRGIGLHSGRECQVAFRPAPVDTGIVFVRDRIEIKASFENVSETVFSTNLERNGVKVRTVEHLVAALVGLGITNVFIDVDGPEIPILDGSAMPWVSLLIKAGLSDQTKPQAVVRILKPVVYGEGSAYVMALPGRGYRVSCRLNFNHPAIREEHMELSIEPDAFVRDIAGARTFGFLKDVDALREKGLAMGGSMDNAIVIGDDRVLNEGGLRYKDEFVRHKILDIIGDMGLLACPIEGRLVANESGHRLHIGFLKHLATHQDSWEVGVTPFVEKPIFQAFGQEVAA